MSIVKFRSKAAAEIVMLGEHADMLLKIMGKERGERGVIQPQDLSEAHAKLVAAVNRDKMSRSHEHEVDPHDLTPREREAHNNRVTLEQRAYPLLKMLEEADKTQVDVHWGF